MIQIKLFELIIKIFIIMFLMILLLIYVMSEITNKYLQNEENNIKRE